MKTNVEVVKIRVKKDINTREIKLARLMKNNLMMNQMIMMKKLSMFL